MKKYRLIPSIIQSVILIGVCLFIFTMKIGTVVSGSMLPNIEIGQSVFYCTAFPYDLINEKDVLVYRSSTNSFIIHRVHEVEYAFKDNKTCRYFYMKGDNNLTTDAEKVTPDNYVGKVIWVVKSEKINTLIKALAKINVLTRIGIVLLIFTIWFLIAEFRCKKKLRAYINKLGNNLSDVEKQTQQFKSENNKIINDNNEQEVRNEEN